MAEDKDSRTEDPTDKRIEKAREDGDVALSQEMGSLASLVAGLAILSFLAPWMLGRLKEMLAVFIAEGYAIPMDFEGLRQVMITLLLEVGVVMAPVFALIMLMAVTMSLVQVGLLWAPKKLEPKLNRISPISGINKLIGKQKLMDLFKALMKLGLVMAVMAVVVVPLYSHPDVYLGQDFQVTLNDLHWLIILLLFGSAVLFGMVAVLDLVWQRHQHKEKLKMTKQEVKDERKQSDGDPQIKARIARMRMERSRQRMMAAVPDASVVITNPTHYAVALTYDMDAMAAPKVVAKGVDHVAFRIRDVAKANDVPIVENPPLARALHAAVELDEEIPAEHYKAVAEVIGFVMRLKGGGTGAGAGAGAGTGRAGGD